MPKPTFVLLAGIVGAFSVLPTVAQEVFGIEVSVRTRSIGEGRALATQAAGEEAARRLGIDPTSTVVKSRAIRNERYEDGRLTAVLDVSVEGTRPTSAGRGGGEGAAISGKGWILVVHAVRGGDGRLVPWARSDPWSMVWRVPTDLKGYRTVPVTGDAEDASVVTGQALDAFEGRAFRHLAAKYRASAVAVVVREGSEAAIAIWRGGHVTDWARVPLGDLSDAGAVRLAVSRAIAESARSAAPLPSAAETSVSPQHGSGSVRISSWRNGADGEEQYRAVLSVDDREDAVARLAAEGIEVLSLQDGPAGAEVVLSAPSGGGIEAGLRRAGLRVNR